MDTEGKTHEILIKTKEQTCVLFFVHSWCGLSVYVMHINMRMHYLKEIIHVSLPSGGFQLQNKKKGLV